MKIGEGDWSDHRVLRRLVDALAWVTWREVAIDDLAATARGPVLLVANHFGGVSDAIVLMSVLPRRPRVLADDQVWKVKPVGVFMDAIGGIPVHRGNRGETDNSDMFAAAHDALARGELVLIFPEGITREEPSIGRVRSGAARIAIGARLAGVNGIRIVPVGIHYDDKAAFRSTVFVREGEAIDIDAELDANGVDVVNISDGDDTERRVVDELTALIETRLRRSAPNYDDWREARALSTASEAFLRSLEPEREVPVGLRDRLAAWLASSGTTELVDTADAYRVALDQLGMSDTWAARGSRSLNVRRVLMAALWILFIPYALLGLAVWAVPAAITWLVTRLRLGPAVMATILPLVVLFTFGLTSGVWLWIAWRVNRAQALVSTSIALPVTFAAAALLLERGLLWWRWSRNKVMTIGSRGRTLTDLRDRTVVAVSDLVTADLDGRIIDPADRR